MPQQKARLWDGISLGLLAAIALLVILTFRSYGNGFDAEVQDVYGRQVLAWFTSLGADRSALDYLDLYYYGGLFDLIAALLNLVSPFGHWATRHLLEAFFGLAGLLGSWRLARHLGGPAAGAIALALLALTPSFYGMMFINPKDIPFASLMIWAVYAMTLLVEELPNPSWRRIAWFGVAAGLALSMRIGGVLLFAYFGLILLGQRRKFGVLLLKAGLPAFCIAWCLMLAAWPWAQVSPILHPLAAIRHFAGMENNIDTLYFGHEIGRRYHPASYLPVYMLLKLPDILLALLAAGLVPGFLALRRGMAWKMAPLLLAALFPVAYAVVTDPELYDAERHFLFVLPPIAVLAGLAAEWFRQQRWARSVFATLLAVGGAWQLYQMWLLHPYEYAFFNDLIGGTKGAYGQFETEYWGASLAEASSDLSQFIRSHHLARAKPWLVAVCGKPSQMGDAPHPDLVPTADWKSADFFVSTTRGGCDRRLAGRTIGEVERDGVPFAIVKDMRSGS
jgi:hypothetical protein